MTFSRSSKLDKGLGVTAEGIPLGDHVSRVGWRAGEVVLLSCNPMYFPFFSSRVESHDHGENVVRTEHICAYQQPVE